MANYQSPTWANNQAPKLNAANLQLLTDTVEESQVLSGTGAPGSSVAAVVGQRYVDESTTPGTIYKCTSVENGVRTWEKEVTRPEFTALEAETQTAYESFATDTASGAVASFQDGADGVPVKSLVVNIAPVQAGEGDPTPDNIRPLSGLTGGTVTRVGKNLFRPYTAPTTSGNVTLTPNNDGSFALEGTASEDPFNASRTLPFPIAPGMAFSFRLGNDRVNSEVGVRLSKFVDGSSPTYGTLYRAEAVDQTVDGAALTSITANRVQTVVASNHGDVETITMRPQLELGAKTSAWEAYTEESVSVSWQSEAGTVYGGTLELPSGVLTVTKKLVTIDENYLVSRITSVTQYDTDTGFWLAMGNDSNTVADKMQNRCNQASPTAAGLSGAATNTFGAGPTYPHSIWMRLATALVGTTAESIHAYISSHPLEFVVSLATPVQYQLPPSELHTVLGVNHIFSDAGEVTVEYRANTNLYIDKRLETLAANFAAVENGDSASRNYTAGEFLVYGGSLYKVSASIASGETLTPGTNITPATVGAELTELEA